MSLDHYGQYICYDTEAEVLLQIGKLGDIAYAKDTTMRYLFDGTNWRPTDATRVLRGIANVDGKTVANTKIITVPPTSFRFVPLAIHVEYLTITGTVGLAPTVSVGTNSTAYNNIATSSGLTTLLASVGLTSPSAFTAANNVTPLAGSTDVYARVSVGATLYSAYTIRLDMFGYYEV